MDRVFLHLRHVRCPTCSRVFCCARHRMEHERRVHVNGIATTLLPVIKRRFRSATADQPKQPSDAAYNVRMAAVNCRKRLHEEGLNADQQNKRKRAYQQEQPQQQREDHDQPDAAGRVILKARRSSFSLIKDMRPVAESSPAVPPIAPPPPLPPTYAVTTPVAATAPVELSFPLEQTPSVAGTPVGSTADSPPSFYQTPMLVMPSPAPAAADATDNARNATSIFDVTPLRDPRTVNDPKPVSLGHNSSQKGFFWSNIARRFRMALRTAKVKAPQHAPGAAPSPTPIPDISKLYGNIQPRRPIGNDSTIQTPVYPRPSLDVIRQAHEEATTRTASE